MRYSYCLVFLFLISCCNSLEKHNHSNVKEIDLSNSYIKEYELPLSDIASSIKYIKLQSDTNCLIGRIREPAKSIQFFSNQIYISDENNLFVFDYTGNFLTKIGSQGRGPGEYLSIDRFTILEEENLVAIFSERQRKVLLYSLDNDYKKSIDIDFYPITFSSFDNNLVFGSSKGRRHLTDYFTLSIINLDGDLITRVINSKWEEEVEKTDKIGLSAVDQLYQYNDKLSYWEFQYDTIFRIDEEFNCRPEYFINAGELRLPFEYILKNKGDRKDWVHYVKVWGFVECENYLFLKVGYKTFLKHILYNKETDESFNVKIQSDEKSNLVFSFTNDIDGGLPFWPQGAASNSKVFSLISGYELKMNLKKKELISPEKIKEPNNLTTLQDLIKEIDLSDNPIIMLVELK